MPEVHAIKGLVFRTMTVWPRAGYREESCTPPSLRDERPVALMMMSALASSAAAAAEEEEGGVVMGSMAVPEGVRTGTLVGEEEKRDEASLMCVRIARRKMTPAERHCETR